MKYRNNFGILSLAFGLMVFYFIDDKFRENNIFNEHNAQSIKIELIDLADLIMLRKNPELICIDLREKKFYDNGHIPKAVNIPLDEFNRKILETECVNFKKTNLVFYSNSKSSDSIESITDFLFQNGISRIKFYSGSWSEWKICNMQIERSSNE